MNTFYMLNDNDWIVTKYINFEPDMWNTKPPVMIWLQVASINLFGFNEFEERYNIEIDTVRENILFIKIINEK